MEFGNLLKMFRDKKVQDIFLCDGENIKVRYLGEIEHTEILCKDSYINVLESSRNKDMYVRESEAKEIDFSFETEGSFRYRVNLFTSLGKRNAVIRVIDNKIPGISDIGIYEKLPEMVFEKKGLSLIAGKTCSGKSTTVAVIVNEILKLKQWHIITLEDPPEFSFKNYNGVVTQRELGRDFNTYSEGIKASLRQSPDLIVIGEIRDKNTLTAAFQAAESGTGVISTIHSKGAKMSLLRMLSMYSNNEKELLTFQLSTYLNFIQSQVLIKGEGKMIMDFQLCINTPAISNAIKENNLNQIENIIYLGKKYGMKDFNVK